MDDEKKYHKNWWGPVAAIEDFALERGIHPQNVRLRTKGNYYLISEAPEPPPQEKADGN